MESNLPHLKPLNNNNITILLISLSIKTIFYKYAIMRRTKTVGLCRNT